MDSESAPVNGLIIAQHLARDGRFIFAIKYIERMNPGISRKEATAVVQSFRYGKTVPAEEDDIPLYREL